MPLTINTGDTSNVTAVLLPTGWEDADPGSFRIEPLTITPAHDRLADEPYGFTFTNNKGRITGRMSTLIAIRTPTPRPLPAE